MGDPQTKALENITEPKHFDQKHEGSCLVLQGCTEGTPPVQTDQTVQNGIYDISEFSKQFCQKAMNFSFFLKLCRKDKHRELAQIAIAIAKSYFDNDSKAVQDYCLADTAVPSLLFHALSVNIRKCMESSAASPAGLFISKLRKRHLSVFSAIQKHRKFATLALPVIEDNWCRIAPIWHSIELECDLCGCTHWNNQKDSPGRWKYESARCTAICEVCRTSNKYGRDFNRTLELYLLDSSLVVSDEVRRIAEGRKELRCYQQLCARL